MSLFDEFDFFDSLSPKELSELLTINNIVRFFNSFGVTDLDVTNDTVVAPTICHNPLGTEAKKKLYWYQNSHKFHCYTECGDNMTIYDLYMKIMALNYPEVEVHFIDAMYYVRQFIDAKTINIGYRSPDAFVSTRDRYRKRGQLLYNEEIDEKVLDLFVPCAPAQWKAEGISQKAMEKYNIRFYIPNSCIVIPQYEYRPNGGSALVGIRCRELEEDKITAYGKYHPVFVGNNKYRHHISYCPFGLAQQQNAVKRCKRAVIMEGEKSVLKGYTLYGEDSIILAACGIASFGSYQINMLTKECGVTDICLALDKEYKTMRSPEYKKWTQMLEEKCAKYSYCANMSYIIDDDNLLDEKDSPIDKGKAVFEQLYQKRIKVSRRLL